METIQSNLAVIEDRIADACLRSRRPRDTVRLMAVSKLQPNDAITRAAALGLRLFGESRVQETRGRIEFFPADAEIHLIGHLQRNKARDAARLYHAVQSLDASRTVIALEEGCVLAERTLSVMIEVNTSGEASKQGVSDYPGIQTVAAAITNAAHLKLNGLMTIGPISSDETVLRSAFATLREYRDRLTAEMQQDLPELSMGMSNDLEAAILEGATMVRIGTSLFGQRNY